MSTKVSQRKQCTDRLKIVSVKRRFFGKHHKFLVLYVEFSNTYMEFIDKFDLISITSSFLNKLQTHQLHSTDNLRQNKGFDDKLKKLN